MQHISLREGSLDYKARKYGLWPNSADHPPPNLNYGLFTQNFFEFFFLLIWFIIIQNVSQETEIDKYV